jgi:hypothetical protein
MAYFVLKNELKNTKNAFQRIPKMRFGAKRRTEKMFF